MKEGKELRAISIKEGGERVADVTRIITQRWFHCDSTVQPVMDLKGDGLMNLLQKGWGSLITPRTLVWWDHPLI